MSLVIRRSPLPVRERDASAQEEADRHYSLGYREGLLTGLKWTEARLDAANDFPCLFCQADRYDSMEGIVHHGDCLMRRLREAIAHVATGRLPGEESDD